MTNVFLVHHTYTRKGGSEEVKFIGAYSSHERAQAAVERLVVMPGFAETPNGFHVDEYRLDQDHWTEGYVTV